ncbi:hypothetical protein [Alloactinosynnema sp. L-07]|nr:hypothetical protein [Alloactinosynnema sp. L-07]
MWQGVPGSTVVPRIVPILSAKVQTIVRAWRRGRNKMINHLGQIGPWRARGGKPTLDR